MPGACTDGRQAIRTVAENQHEALAAAIGRIHELGEELATMPVVEREERFLLPMLASDAEGWEPEWRD